MNARELIKKVCDDAQEWLEMTHDPTTIVVGILANKVIKLNEHIEFLEKRLEYVNRKINYSVRDN